MKKTLVWCLFFTFFTSQVHSATLTETMRGAAEHFAGYVQKIQADKKRSIQTVINLGSKVEDDLGRMIKQTLYQELQAQNVDFSPPDSTRKTEFAYILTGAYIKIGKKITLKLSLSEGEIIHTQFETKFLVEDPLQK